MHRTEIYRGFEISWEDPPLTSDRWTVNIASNDPPLMAMLGSSAKVIDAATRDETIAKAKRSIDHLLGPALLEARGKSPLDHQGSTAPTLTSSDGPPPRDRLRDSIPGLAWEQRGNAPFYPNRLDVTAGSSPRPPFPPYSSPEQTPTLRPEGDTTAPLQGVATTAVAETITPEVIVPLQRAQVVRSTSGQSVGAQVVPLQGVGATGVAGTLGSEVSVSLQGVAATGIAASFAPEVSVPPEGTSVEQSKDAGAAFGVEGGMDASADVILGERVRAEMLTHVDEISAALGKILSALKQAPPTHGGIGHNYDRAGLTAPVIQLVTINVTVQTVGAEIRKPAQNTSVMAQCGALLKTMMAELGKEALKHVLKREMIEFWPAVQSHAMQLIALIEQYWPWH